MLLTVGRARTLAWYACLLEATHHPELREILAYGRASRALARTLLAQAGVADPDRAHRDGRPGRPDRHPGTGTRIRRGPSVDPPVTPWSARRSEAVPGPGTGM
ncbi:hypothetical protein [Plantactinospora sp. B24E8]|uniref:hypothetical protein n=1 Tax=Plantactinospora sp. B24E8 TaxID=3153567 RepID=UPI00325F5E12